MPSMLHDQKLRVHLKGMEKIHCRFWHKLWEKNPHGLHADLPQNNLRKELTNCRLKIHTTDSFAPRSAMGERPLTVTGISKVIVK